MPALMTPKTGTPLSTPGTLARAQATGWVGEDGQAISEPAIDIPNPLDPLGSISSTFGFLSALGKPSTWVRIGFVLGGFLILLIGVAALARSGGRSEDKPEVPPPVTAAKDAVEKGAEAA